MQTNNMSIGIVGSGTAGLITALTLRKAFPNSEITIVASSKIGIIGVGEGSTEHWRQFMDLCNIPTEELISNTAATHKYGIRFENWTEKIPDYFHSVSGPDEIFAHGLFASYLHFIENEKLITSQTASIGLVRNQVPRQNLHKTTNQFHFDTFKLNDYLTNLCFSRMIRFIDDSVSKVNLDSENGCIVSVDTELSGCISADFWFDASGFNRVLMTSLGNTKWTSFSPYLLADSAVAFPTESDPNGQIKPYTRARAMSSGWVFEIPTQERRGNGYVYSSAHISQDEAIKEVQQLTGYKVPDNPRTFKFDAGFLETQWVKNCVAVGLASSFVEPLEATSIGSSIIQAKSIIESLSSYQHGYEKIQNKYNKNMTEMMRNILTMIRLHYISDRRDTPFWKEQAEMRINSELQELIELWSEKPPSRYDIPGKHNTMFHVPHFVHVMQGQGLIPTTPSSVAIDRMGLREIVTKEVNDIRNSRHSHELVDHRQALLEIDEIDDEF
jgi:tryptophan halogenase